MARLKGSKPNGLDNPYDFPQIFSDVYSAFMRLDAYRSGKGFALSTISYLELDAYCRLTGNRFNEFEIDLIKKLDVLSINAKAKKDK